MHNGRGPIGRCDFNEIADAKFEPVDWSSILLRTYFDAIRIIFMHKHSNII